MEGLLKKATAADDNPTPGYVYVELAKLTHTDLTVCDKMADWLAGALLRLPGDAAALRRRRVRGSSGVVATGCIFTAPWSALAALG